MSDRTNNLIALALITLAVCCHYLDFGLGINNSDLSQGLLVAGTTMLRVYTRSLNEIASLLQQREKQI